MFQRGVGNIAKNLLEEDVRPQRLSNQELAHRSGGGGQQLQARS